MIHYFLGTRLLDTGQFFPWDDTRTAAGHLAFMCPHCGEVWGRVVSDKPDERWLCLHHPCRRHGRDYSVGGSFINSWLRDISFLPPKVLAYELDIHLEHHENGRLFL